MRAQRRAQQQMCDVGNSRKDDVFGVHSGSGSSTADADCPETFKMVTLPCQIKKGGDVSSSVLVTNNSGYTIPVNTKVYVEIAGTSPPNLQQSVFANNTTRQMYGPADHSGSCTAKASVAVN